jgi:hypothetical protein
MARTKAILGASARLSDYLSASLLARVFPFDPKSGSYTPAISGPEGVHGGKGRVIFATT